MKKSDDLRAAVAAALPEFRNEPDRLRIWIENGTAQCRQTASLSFGFAYRLNLLFVEASSDIALVALPIFRWLRVNQPDLLAPGAAGFSFDVDVLDNATCDILVQLDLAENVAVASTPDGGWTLDYLAEPDPLFMDGEPLPGMAAAPDLAAVITHDDEPPWDEGA